MFTKRNNEEEDYSYYWRLTNAWREDKRFSEDEETLDTKRRKMMRADGIVAPENTHVYPAAYLHHVTSPVETIRRVGQTRDFDCPMMKRDIVRESNKYASRKCRQMKKEYVKQLETRVAALENQNKTLLEEVNAMRDLYGIKTECLSSTEADEYD